ncbi:MAG: type VI secretion system tube protein Hcp, partial [Fibrobacter sp.]|nr:type VI secretion system tube protein Hcp [Fibrobacter sp.]
TFYGTGFIRKHDPLIIIKPIDKLTMSICNYLINKTFLPKIEIGWYKYNEKNKNLEEYFRTTLENARITSQRIILPDVKDKILEKYDQTEEVTFAYQRITWLYHKGYLLFTDEWNECYDELYLKDFSGKEEDPFAYLESMPVVEPLKIKFTKAQLVEPENGFQIDKKVKAKYQAEFSREPTTQECKVFAKLYARYKGQVEDLRLIHEGWIYKDGTWSTEFKLEKPCLYEKDKDKKDDAVIEYFTEIENRYAEGNFRGEIISVPVKKLKLEIKDMEGPEELVHNRSGIYTVKFNRKASDNEKGKVSWVVRINGEETDRFDNAGETLEFTPIGKYAGETVTVHPFLRSPSDELCVETTVGECLVFNGSKLIWLDEKHKEKGKVGRPKLQSCKTLPRGSYPLGEHDNLYNKFLLSKMAEWDQLSMTLSITTCKDQMYWNNNTER